MEIISASTLADVCLPDGWHHKARSAVRRSRVKRQSKDLSGPPLLSGNAHPKRLLGEAEISALYRGRRYEDVRLKR